MLKSLYYATSLIIVVTVLSASIARGAICNTNTATPVPTYAWNATSSWACGHVPVMSDDAYLQGAIVNVDVDVSTNLVNVDAQSTLNAGSYSITLSGYFPLFVDGSFNAETSTVKFSDADHEVKSSFTLYNWQWATPLTAPRTLTIRAGYTVTKAAGGTFNLNGSSATNTVTFAGTGSIAGGPITVNNCAGSTVTGIICVPPISPAPTVSSVSASTANGSYNAGDTVNVTVKVVFPEPATGVVVEVSFTAKFAASAPDKTIFGVPLRVRFPEPVFSMVNIIAPLLPPTATVPKSCVPADAIFVAPCFRLISGAVPVPIRSSVYGFSSLSLLAMLICAVFAPVEDGVNVTVKVVFPDPATGEVVKV